MNYLSKSDFKVARTCAAKLFYKKSKYSSSYDDDPYMQMLAEGGYMVGKLAQLLYPTGVLIADLDVDRAIKETQQVLTQQNVVVFEPAIFCGGFLARIDVLIKSGNRFELIEVKSKAGDSAKQPSPFRGTKGGIESGWREYLEDIAFQRFVLALAFPHAEIDCFLLLPDKAKRTVIDNLPARFAIQRSGKQIEVEYRGSPEELVADNLLTKFDVNAEVAELLPEVTAAAAEFLPLVINGQVRAPVRIGYHCKDCEFQAPSPDLLNGFRECWGAKAEPSPHIFDLGHLNSLNTKKTNFLVEQLIAAGTTSLNDVPLDKLTGAYAPRQSIQIQYSRRNEEWRSPQLDQVVSSTVYPIHFIDFETSRLALPYHRGMRPYEQVAFQWSCHTMASPTAVPVHAEWINLGDSFPNFEFCSQLRQTIGDNGTVLMWSHFERSVLNDIAVQMGTYGKNDPELITWIQQITAEGGRLVDMAKMCEEHYFHPEMKGKVSIKFVLPAVWSANQGFRNLPYFSKYLKQVDGKLLNPYGTLPPLEIVDRAEVVAEGTGAMRAYQEMLYGEHRENLEVREQWQNLLLQYCELDTAAMVMIWKHWQG